MRGWRRQIWQQVGGAPQRPSGGPGNARSLQRQRRLQLQVNGTLQRQSPAALAAVHLVGPWTGRWRRRRRLRQAVLRRQSSGAQAALRLRYGVANPRASSACRACQAQRMCRSAHSMRRQTARCLRGSCGHGRASAAVHRVFLNLVLNRPPPHLAPPQQGRARPRGRRVFCRGFCCQGLCRWAPGAAPCSGPRSRALEQSPARVLQRMGRPCSPTCGRWRRATGPGRMRACARARRRLHPLRPRAQAGAQTAAAGLASRPMRSPGFPHVSWVGCRAAPQPARLRRARAAGIPAQPAGPAGCTGRATRARPGPAGLQTLAQALAQPRRRAAPPALLPPEQRAQMPGLG